jgi:hypothetical protein
MDDEFYLGSVKGYKIVNTVDIQVTNRDDPLLPGAAYIKNGIVKLVFETTGIEYYYWDNDTQAYVLLDTIDIGTIESIQPIVINSLVWQVRVENCIITLKMGRPFFHIKHPYTDLDYTLKDNYYHDNALTEDPAADASIGMESRYYCTAYDDNADYGMLIVKYDPTTIKSDSIPADDLTAIGHYKLDATGYNTPGRIAKETFLNDALFRKPFDIG